MDIARSLHSAPTTPCSASIAHLRKRRRQFAVLISVALLLTPALLLFHVSAAGSFANPAFQTQWNAGEAITPNFWGPLPLARDGQNESYVEAPGGARLVQYFDKARMELTNPSTGVVTNGLLATELITGNRQLGDSTFQNVGPAAVPVAGDPDNIGPTYASIQANAAQLRAAVSSTIGAGTTIALTPAGALSAFPSGASDPQANIAAYDPVTQHNVPAAFANFRATAGIPAIGYAISEPFWSNVKVAGVQKDVLMQAFERRVLTYTPTNPDPFKVEFGNIGQHYYTWRYVTAPAGGATPTSTPTATPTTTPTAPAAAAPTLSSVALSGITTTGVMGAYTTNVAACGTLEYRVAGIATFTTDIGTITCGSPGTMFSKPLTGLAPATSYEVRGAAFTSPGSIGYSSIVPFTTLALDTTAPTVSAVAFTPVDKNNMKVTFTLSEPGAASVKYGTAADLSGGTTVAATGAGGNTFQATFGITRETQYYYQITATDLSANTGSTLVKQVRLDRGINVTVKTLTVKANHFTPGIFPFADCEPSYTYIETIKYATGTPGTKTFTFNEAYAASVPKDDTVGHTETFPEDATRAIALNIDGLTVPNGPNPGCLMALAAASATLTPAGDWSVGAPSVLAESADMKVTLVVTDTLTPTFTT